MNISVLHVANLLEFAASLGLNNKVLRDQFVKDPNKDLSCIENTVTLQELRSIIRELIVKTSDDFLGLHYGCFLNLKAVGLIYNISKSATHVGQAILLVEDFLKHTFSAFEIVQKNKGTATHLQLQCSLGDKLIKRHLSDSTLCVLYRELKLMTGGVSGIHIHFPYVEIKEYRRMFGDDVKRGNIHAISFNKKVVNQLLNQNGIMAIGELLPAFMYLLEKVKRQQTFSSQVRKMLLSMSDPSLPTFEQVSAQFPMSQRTFQRKLTSEGCSFRSISNDIKRGLAKYLSGSGKLKTKDVAGLLGYSESSAYLHALKKWENK